MNYNEFINSIISSRGQWAIPECGIWENHHIIPKCMGGEPSKYTHDMMHANLIWLSPKEHYIAHKLLVEENPENQQLNFAFWRLVTANNKILTAEEYEASRLLFKNNLNHEYLSEIAKIRTSNLSEETLKNRSIKTSNTWKSKSDLELKEITNKRNNTISSKSDEEKLLEHERRSEAHKGLDCKGGFYNKINGEWIKKDDDEVKNIGVKISNSLKNRNEEDKLISINKRKQTMSLKSDEEIKAMYRKAALKRTGVKRDSYHFTEDGLNRLRESAKSRSGEKSPMWGTHRSEATKEKIRQKALGRRNPNAIIIYCLELRRYFMSKTEACEIIGINKGALNNCINTGQDYKGMHFINYNEV